MRGNASVGLYNTISEEYKSNLFGNNNAIPLGDVLQSITEVNDEYWIVMNNSGKIYVVDQTSFKVKHEITGFTSPRYVQVTTDGKKAFVTDLYSDEISVVSTSNYKVSNTIPLDGWSEQMVYVDGHIWVANREKPYVFLIDPVKETVVDSIKIGNNTSSLIQLHTLEVAALSEGKLNSSDSTKIFKLDPKARQVIDVLTFPKEIKPIHLVQEPETHEIYTLHEGVYAIKYHDFSNNSKVLDLPGTHLYGIGIDPANRNVFLSNAKDFVERSEVSVYSKDFSLKQQFEAGVICNGFVFK
jgi:YVTN family beta-propeller protein